MPLDKHNSRTAGARDLISSTSLHPEMYLFTNWCLHHGATTVSLWSPILSSQPRKVTICGRHTMASVWDIKIAEALIILCLSLFLYLFTWSLLIVKLQKNFSYACLFTFLKNNNFSWLANLCILLYKKEWLVRASRINHWNTHKPVHFILSYILSVTQ